ncbi:MAG: hypothetical protein K5770_03620 [Lachnospiraceae bacterium]|nr:hypothetical protein [Lachnospiraceae bacterium]
MKIRNRFLASILTASMLASMLTGCAATPDIAAPAEPAAEQAAETETETETVTESEVSEDEQAAAAEAETAAQNMLAIAAKGYTGLTNLVNKNNDDGSYYYEDMTEDGDTIITNMCAPAKDPGDDGVEAYVKSFVEEAVKEGCEVNEVSLYEELSADLSYPAYRVNWEWGSNEDTRWGTGVVIPTDTFTYYYGYSCPADFYEDNEAFYDEELKGIELISIEDVSADSSEQAVSIDRAALSLGNDENKGEESEEIEPEAADIAADASGSEKKQSDDELTRDFKPAETAVTAKDLAGYWKYDAYDEMYLAIYDSGSYETYDMKTDDLLTEGKYEINGSQLEMTEKGADSAEILTILGPLRLKDNEGDTLSPYIPVKPTTANTSDSSEVNRRYGEYDAYYEEQSDGRYKLRSPSKGVYLVFPSWYNSGEADDYLWASDGDIACVTARNVTDEYYSFAGTDEEFLRKVGSHYLVQDFFDIYGENDGIADSKYTWGNDNGTVATITANMWNDWYDVNVCTKLFVSGFNDGTCEIMIINSFYGYGDNSSKENMKAMAAGAMH